MDEATTKEPQYQEHITLGQTKGLTQLGFRANATWHQDPRRLLFVLSRYKFVSKMLSGKQKVLEVGCGDAFATRIVLQEVGSICAIDFDPVFVDHVNEQMEDPWTFDCRVHDMLSGPVEGGFDAAYSLDVIEHIPKEDECTFVNNIAQSLSENGVLIVGAPSIQSQVYASEGSKQGHINCKDQKELKALMQNYFFNVFMFSMNDEVVHTGFHPMAHYLFALCVGRK
ncbi:class I SAM-dependent methyltransferase [Lusitaniella coriacea LEGE 07157]|uniref:Class I SAM-dependent methyltransferase n=1 Tax=Lusitaniella coriacea LEGE 07157 TaxID=945747 RepID=A0A8J7DX77_9CYAN|nr:class I SAM-dependent methyltransferase [Lusitaniella coriacea]MBE9116866.1 class I SAM-dependent methyltransferase [Lusitaniella coriacea LEGE 07157]